MKNIIPLLWILFPHTCPQPVQSFFCTTMEEYYNFNPDQLIIWSFSMFAFTPVTTEIQVESTAGLCSNIKKEEQNLVRKVEMQQFFLHRN